MFVSAELKKLTVKRSPVEIDLGSCFFIRVAQLKRTFLSAPVQAHNG